MCLILDASKLALSKIGVCMGWVGLGWEDFLTQPTMVGQKKFNPTQPIIEVQPNPMQPTWVGLGRVEPMGWTKILLLLLLLNWVEKKYKYKYI